MRTLAGLPLRKRLFLVAALYAGLALSLVPWMATIRSSGATQLLAIVVAVLAAGSGCLSRTWETLGTLITINAATLFVCHRWYFWWQYGGNSAPVVVFTLVSVAAWIVLLHGAQKESNGQAEPRQR